VFSEVRPRKDHPGIDVTSDVPPFGRLWYGEPNAISNAVGYAKFCSRSHDAVIRVYGDMLFLAWDKSVGSVKQRHYYTGKNLRGIASGLGRRS
jgi:hypothetical protein